MQPCSLYFEIVVNPATFLWSKFRSPSLIHQCSMLVMSAFFHVMPCGRKMTPSNSSWVTGFLMCELLHSPIPSSLKWLSCPRKEHSMFTRFVGWVFFHVRGKISQKPPPCLPLKISSIHLTCSFVALRST